MKSPFLSCAAGLVLAVSGLVLALGGCATVSGSQTQDFGGMITERTPFSMGGPAQSVPDDYLERGARISIVGSGGEEGWMRVQTVDGRTGFVHSGAVGEAAGESPSGRP